MNLTIPEKLARTCSTWPDRREWLARLPEVVAELQARSSLSLGEPYEAAQASWVAPVTDQPAVLKVGMPHMEADHEIEGTRFWDGEPNPTVAARCRGQRHAAGALLSRYAPGRPA